ncbi:MAG: D-glycero-beta-D-manno-heptose 1-phosphate adenylyltransferase [Nitrospirae bacterium]|nr:MAG: D-glycero-beta-D-manno-heptose 1-phosphate adenylyltransferase [Nitrospirota bacterium]
MGEILGRQELIARTEALKSEGKKIVFTNGCFDILHVGHIRYLKESRGLGDILIVGLNSDASVNRLKPNRPIVAEACRAELLAALTAVDFVTIFGEDTPYELIKRLRPDVLVKGGDWKKEDIVGSDIAKETYSLPFVQGMSTTGIVEKILELGRNKDL